MIELTGWTTTFLLLLGAFFGAMIYGFAAEGPTFDRGYCTRACDSEKIVSITKDECICSTSRVTRKKK